MSAKKTIALDLDCVVFDTNAITTDFLVNRLGIVPQPNICYDFSHYHPRIAKAILNFYQTEDACTANLCNTDFPAFYDYLRTQDYYVKFVSARNQKLLDATIAQFAVAGLPHIPKEDIVLLGSSKKADVLAQIQPVMFVDDAPKVVLAAVRHPNLTNTKIGLVSNETTEYNHHLRNHARLTVGTDVIDVLKKGLFAKTKGER